MDDQALDAAVMRHARQFREGIAARSLRVTDPGTGHPADPARTLAAVIRLLGSGHLRWKNPAVRNRVITTRPRRRRDDETTAGTLW